MKRLFHALIPLFLLILQLPAATAKPGEAAEQAARQWLTHVDSGSFEQSWKSAAVYFQAAVPQEQWVRQISAVRAPLGALVSRTLKSATYATSLPGAPDGQYVVLQFQTVFANKKEAA